MGESPNAIENSTGFPIQVTYSDIEGGFPGTGNINVDPRFCNAAAGNLRLQDAPPNDLRCINHGSNALLPADAADVNDNGNPGEDLPWDLLEFDRIYPPLAQQGVVDMGAYENPHGPCPADLNHDGSVDLADLALLLSCFGQQPAQGACSAADLNCDGAIGLSDLTILLSQFGSPCAGFAPMSAHDAAVIEWARHATLPQLMAWLHEWQNNHP